jgi:hypothetical protein
MKQDEGSHTHTGYIFSCYLSAFKTWFHFVSETDTSLRHNNVLKTIGQHAYI